VLEISVASLFDAHTGELVRSDEYPRINFGGERLVEFLLTPQSEQQLQAIFSEIEPGGGSGDELYSLPAEIEFAVVLAGSSPSSSKATSSCSSRGTRSPSPPRPGTRSATSTRTH
jgi:hypothetical protein